MILNHNKELFIAKAKLSGFEINDYDDIVVLKSPQTNLYGVYDAISGNYTAVKFIDYYLSDYFFYGVNRIHNDKPNEAELYIFKLPGNKWRKFSRSKFLEVDFENESEVAGVWLPNSNSWYLVNSKGKTLKYGPFTYAPPRVHKLKNGLYRVNGFHIYDSDLNEIKDIVI